MKKAFIFTFVLCVFGACLSFAQHEPFENHIFKRDTAENDILQKVFPGVVFIVETSRVTLPPSTRLIASLGNRSFLLPDAFNYAYDLVKSQSQATEEEIIGAFIHTAYWLTEREEKKSISVHPVSTKHEGRNYNYKADLAFGSQAYTLLIQYDENQITWVEVFFNDQRVNIITPLPVHSTRSKPDININGVSPVTYDSLHHYYITVNRNGNATNDSIKLVISSLEPLQQNVKLQIKPIYGFGGSFFLNQLLSVNDQGVASFTWKPANDNNTGICFIQIDVNGVVHNYPDIRIIPDKKITGVFTTGYSYTIYYTNQFFGHPQEPHPEGIGHASTFALHTRLALIESWESQVVDWELCQGCTNNQPHDADNHYVVSINDKRNNFRDKHSKIGNYAVGGANRLIGISFNRFMTEPYYLTEVNSIRSVMSHEFYHGIQWSLINNNTWGSGNWMLEGQATFIQTVQYPELEFDIVTYYNRWANEYLNKHTWRSLKNLSYSYALFWRFLYENYTSGTVKEKLEIIRETCRGNTNATIPGIKMFMDSKLSGAYNSFTDALKDFTRRAYLNDCQYNLWNPCPGDNFYVKPPILRSDTLRDTCDYKWQSWRVYKSFGFFFHEYNIQSSAPETKFIFYPDDLNNGPGNFHVNLLLFKNNALVEELTADATSNILSYDIDNVSVDKIVVGVLRMDPFESDSSKMDFGTTVSVPVCTVTVTHIKQPTCKGGNDGSATVQAICAEDPPYSYFWSNGATGPTVTGLSAGDYNVFVRDTNNCYGSVIVTIPEPEQVSLHFSGTYGGITFCSGDRPPDITIHAYATGGTPPYSYSWPDQTLVVNTSGTYSCVVTDSIGCSDTAKVMIKFIPVFCPKDPNDITGPS
jgi:hypothetical protein